MFMKHGIVAAAALAGRELEPATSSTSSSSNSIVVIAMRVPTRLDLSDMRSGRALPPAGDTLALLLLMSVVATAAC